MEVSVTRKIVTWCGKEMSEMKHLSVETIREYAGRSEEGRCIFGLRRERKDVVPIDQIVVKSSGRHYVPLLGMEGSALERLILKELVSESWSYVLIVKKMKRGVILKLRNHRWLRGRLRQCLSDACSTTK